ncbi:MAG: hypothetical protein JWP08_1356 [Bryobacterales bacterium]|nr:hypothetical protein [Bryobacterales bacterium]
MTNNAARPETIRFVPTLYALTIFLSAFLLFLLEPLIAKQILPWFGGSAAVWATCLVFYQVVLLAGYYYAGSVGRLGSAKTQSALHVAVLALSLAFLPVGPGIHWRTAAVQHPAWLLLEMLAASIALPFLALSATSPLLQHWLGAAGHRTPYKLFAVSNFASLAALIAYPLIVEPKLDMSGQRIWWSIGYTAFAIACATCALLSRRAVGPEERGDAPADDPTFDAGRKLLCLALAGCASMLLLALTNHLTENIAPVPLLWILPLAVYLLTLVLAFGPSRIYRRMVWLRFLAVGLGVLEYSIYDIDAVEAVQVSIPVSLAGLFVCCMFCHGELSELRPAPRYLTSFYLMVATGGACGAIFVGLIAPQIFTGIFELPLSLFVTACLAAVVTWPMRAWAVRVLWFGISIAAVLVLYVNVSSYEKNSLSSRRSFYGALRVVQSPHAGTRVNRTLFHGTVEHGAQFLLPPMRFRPTTYYGPDSGIGIVLRECYANPKRVGVVGLGIGTIAADGQSGDTFRFYEINRQVEDMASSLFFYLRETHAKADIVTGDARLSLETESGPPFDVIALDAFSGDAIPVHLITREALAVYLKHLKADGSLAFHVSNHFLDLASVVKQLAVEAGYSAIGARNHEDDDNLLLPADWVIVTRNKAVLENASLKAHAMPIADRFGLRPWTDDYNNLLEIIKTPGLK